MTFHRAAAIALLAACADPASSGPLSVATYNAGIARGFVAAADARADNLPADVAALDADVICLQEVWAPSDVDAVTTALADTWPHVVAPEPEQQTTGMACDDGELTEW